MRAVRRAAAAGSARSAGSSGSAGAAGAADSGAGSATDGPATDGRDLDLRLARLHLRTGATWLARAELEQLAAARELPVEGLAVLSVARWRTGERAAAAEAADAHLAAGGTDPGALVVAAEAAARDGRPADAAKLVDRAVAADPGGSTIEAVVDGLSTVAPWPTSGGRRAGPAAVGPGPGATSASRSGLDGALDDLAAGRIDRAALRLMLVLRRQPDLAAAVVDAIGDRREPALELVRGDALRAVGHGAEAERAYAAASAGLEPDGGPARPRGER